MVDGIECMKNQIIICVDEEKITREETVKYLAEYQATIAGYTLASYQVEFSETVTIEEIEADMEIFEKEDWITMTLPNYSMGDEPQSWDVEYEPQGFEMECEPQ